MKAVELAADVKGCADIVLVSMPKYAGFGPGENWRPLRPRVGTQVRQVVEGFLSRYPGTKDFGVVMRGAPRVRARVRQTVDGFLVSVPRYALVSVPRLAPEWFLVSVPRYGAA